MKKILMTLTIVCSSALCSASTSRGSRSSSPSGSSQLFAGIGYFSQNSLFKTTTKDTGKTDLLGAAMYPVIFGYKTTLFSDWVFTPQIYWTLLSRDTETSTNSFIFLDLPVGKTFSGSWEWYAGPGLMYYTIKGKGGSKVLSNGTGTATFAVGDKTVTTKTITMDLGVAYNINSHRLTFGSVSESFLSMTGKRSYNLYFNWTFGLGGLF